MNRRTGSFDDVLKTYYDAESGAFTQITAAEIQKQTFNVKAVIRNLLVEKIGLKEIPAHGDADTKIEFMLPDDLSAIYGISHEISCKFSKPDKAEMSIYFSNASFIPKSSLHVGDCWCIYFKKDDLRPWFGYIASSVMQYIHSDFVGELCLEDDEIQRDKATGVKSLDYQYDINKTTISRIEKPACRVTTATRRKVDTQNRTVTVAEMKVVMDNRKKKGTRGEQLILKAEKEKLRALHRADLAKKVVWRAQKVDGLGYDIESYETDAAGRNEHKIYIEVKSTSQNEFTPFFVSRNEVAVSRKLGDNYFIYRVFNIKSDSKSVGYYRVCGNIEDSFELSAETYSAFLK